MEDYRLWIRFSDGVEGVVDLSGYAGKGVFALWDDYRAFRDVQIGPGGELHWGDEIDMCADALYLRVTGKRPEDLFLALLTPTPPVASLPAT